MKMKIYVHTNLEEENSVVLSTKEEILQRGIDYVGKIICNPDDCPVFPLETITEIRKEIIYPVIQRKIDEDKYEFESAEEKQKILDYIKPQKQADEEK